MHLLEYDSLSRHVYNKVIENSFYTFAGLKEHFQQVKILNCFLFIFDGNSKTIRTCEGKQDFKNDSKLQHLIP